MRLDRTVLVERALESPARLAKVVRGVAATVAVARALHPLEPVAGTVETTFQARVVRSARREMDRPEATAEGVPGQEAPT